MINTTQKQSSVAARVQCQFNNKVTVRFELYWCSRCRYYTSEQFDLTSII